MTVTPTPFLSLMSHVTSNKGGKPPSLSGSMIYVPFCAVESSFFKSLQDFANPVEGKVHSQRTELELRIYKIFQAGNSLQSPEK